MATTNTPALTLPGTVSVSTIMEKVERLVRSERISKDQVFNILVRSIVIGTFHQQMIFLKDGRIYQYYDLDTVNSIKWDILERALELFPDFPSPEDMAGRITQHTGEFVIFDNEDLYNWECMYEQKLASIEQ